MRISSVNISPGRTVTWKGRSVQTGIFKEPVPGRVAVRHHQLEGDKQADLSVHGGEYKAVYAYAEQHYAWWRGELGRELLPGSFGENLTLAEFPEEEICIGDALQFGDAVLEAVQPRLPCFKLGLRFDDAGMVKRFLDSGRWGVYFRVLTPGALGAGDEGKWLRKDPARFPVPELARLYFSRDRDPEQLRRALSLAALPPQWREELQGGNEK